MNYYAFLPLAVFYTISLLFYHLYPRRNEHQAINGFLFGALCVMFWALIDFLLWLPVHSLAVPLLFKLPPYGWFGIGYSSLVFVYGYLGLPRDHIYRIIVGIIICVYLFYSFLVWSPLAPFRIPSNAFGFYGLWVLVFSLLTFTLPVSWATWLMFRAWRMEKYLARRRILGYFLLASTASVIFILLTGWFATKIGIPVPVITFISTLMVNLLIMYSVQRLGFLGFNLSVVGKELFAAMRDGVLILNKENQVININPAAEFILGVSQEGLPVGLSEILPEVGQAVEADNIIFDRDSRFHILRYSTTPLQDSWNDSLRLLILSDMTDVRRAEKRAIEMELQQKVTVAIESERRRFARDLHDGVNQNLYSIKLITEVLPVLLKKNPISAQRRIEALHILAQNALAEMRSLLMELRPERVSSTPMPELLRMLCRVDAVHRELKIITDIDDSVPLLPPQVHLAFYRVAQESIHNSIKYSHAGILHVAYRGSPDEVILVVRDDGRGFLPNAVRGNHFGLNNMRERAEEINALLEINSSPGNGTNIQLTWKLHFGEEKND